MCFYTEDPGYSTPDGSGILCATVYFFFATISGPFKYKLDRDIEEVFWDLNDFKKRHIAEVVYINFFLCSLAR